MPAVRGDREVVRAMRAMKSETTRSLDPVMKSSLEPLRSTAAKNARALRQPGKSPAGGHLDQGVVTRKISGSTNLRVFWVGLINRARGIGHLVEFGTAPHWQPKRKRMHPGAKPHPWFTPAYVATKAEIISDLTRQTLKAVYAAAHRFGSRR